MKALFPGGTFHGDTYKLSKAEADNFWKISFGNKCVDFYFLSSVAVFWLFVCFVLKHPMHLLLCWKTKQICVVAGV